MQTELYLHRPYPLCIDVPALKRIVKYLEKKHSTNIPVQRRDGKKGAPLKADYVFALRTCGLLQERCPTFYQPEGDLPGGGKFTGTLYLTDHIWRCRSFPSVPVCTQILPELPLEVWLRIFCLDFHPEKFRLINKEMSEKVNTDAFYRLVCENLGYTAPMFTQPPSRCYRDFFLNSVSTSRLGRPEPKNISYWSVWLIDIKDNKVLDMTIIDQSETLTVGQIRHLAMERFNIHIPARWGPCETISRENNFTYTVAASPTERIVVEYK